jgi:asparagine synthase (glutamine-hydrolysing)
VLAQEPDIVWKPVAPGKPGDRRTMKADRILSDAPDDPENVICADARRQGADVILSGWGGDEASTFNGRGALADAFASGRWIYLAQQVEALKRLRGFKRRHTLRGDVVGMLAPGMYARLQRRMGRRGHDLDEMRGALVRPELTMQALADASPALVIDGDVRRNQLRLTRGVHIAMRTANWAEIGAPFGIAFAFPMLDRRVLDVALSLHPTWHLRGGLRRSPFREAMRGILPEAVRTRFGKITPFPSSMYSMAAEIETLRRECEDLIDNPAVTAVYDRDACLRVLAELPTREEVARDPSRAIAVFSITPLLSYGRLLADNPVAPSPSRN